MNTPYSIDNQAFSDRAHCLAREAIYPSLFDAAADALTFDDVTGVEAERNKVLDGEMAVDKIVNVTVHGLGAPLIFTVQERFRRPDAARFRDITITEWNNNSNKPSELYKIRAWLFLYGYYDADCNHFVGETVVVNVPALWLRLATNQIEYASGRNPRSNQRFITVSFDALREYGLVEWRQIWPRRQIVALF